MSAIIAFLGRFHPLIVHLPIGFLLLAAIFEFLGRKPRYSELKSATGFTLFLGAASAVVACILGYFLSLEGGYEENSLFWHQWIGIALAVFAVLAYLVYSEKLTVAKIGKNKLMTGLLAAIAVGLMLSGHLGGSLTHGEDYLTQYMPFGQPDKNQYQRPAVADFDSAEIFTHVIHPILETRCASCHNPGKTKGKLKLTTKGDILKGGKHGSILTKGDAKKSALFHRVILPLDDDEHMPPEGKKQLTDEQVAILKWWIEKDAPFEGTLASMEISDEMRAVLTEDLGLSEKNKGLLAHQIEPLPAAVIRHLDSLDLGVKPIAKDNHYLEVNLAFTQTPIDQERMNTLLDAKDHIVWMNLAGLDVKDVYLETIGQMPNLLRLHLENSQVSDAGLAKLGNLQSLEYLNLHHTNVTDECLQTIARLPNLKKVFLWNTKVTQKAADELKAQRPELEINMGTTPKPA